ncbi:unnamed protein product [Peniophora sp. CBMAI 1063]|nr:unnamed protein product [Peniophora sp. CBMAI 1063]
MTRKAPTYGDIADAVLPSVVFTVDTLNKLAQDVDTYVRLAPSDRPAFFREQMGSIWPESLDWSHRPQTPEFKNQWSALRRYYKEQGRIRGPPALPEKLSTRKWTGLRVCGIVYRDSIDEMVFLGTGMRPGDPRGYIGHRIKCRTVFYWKLPSGERLQLTEMANEWQSGAAPAEQKMEAYYRRFQTWIRNVHITALREFGQHLVTMAIPEPGLTNPPRLHEFMHELRILEKPLVKTIPIGDTLADIYREVNHAAGRIEGAALPTILNKKSRLKRKTTWTVDDASFVGRDELVLSEDEYEEELFFKEAIAMVYTIVRMAHSNISSFRDLDPPWASFHQLVDSRYLLPDVPMSIPTALRQPNCFKYLKHWFTVTKGLKFNQWQRKNSLPMDPVPLAERWWAHAVPRHLLSTGNIPPGALAAVDYVPKAVEPLEKAGLGIDASPFGSQGGHTVHEETMREQDILEVLDIPTVPDPDDLLPVSPLTQHAGLRSIEDDIPPYLVPINGEARGQWSLSQLRNHCEGLSPRSMRSFIAAVKQLVELPVSPWAYGRLIALSKPKQMIPNCSYPLKAAGKRTRLPDDLRWTMCTAEPTSGDVVRWISFLQGSPWRLAQGGSEVFSGMEMVWTFVLGWVLYLRGYAAAGGSSVGDQGVGNFAVGAATFARIFSDFHQALCHYAEQYQFPGWAPCVKYALVNSRTHYLAYVMRNEEQDVLLPLLRLEPGPLEAPFVNIPHSSDRNAPSWITERNGVPSWQWQRCGLPPSAHQLPHLAAVILEWLHRPDLLVDVSAGKARSRETGLAIMLKVALIFADVENLQDENWSYAGAASLCDSTLRPYVEQVKTAIAEWANDAAVGLEAHLPEHDESEVLGAAAAEADSPERDSPASNGGDHGGAVGSQRRRRCHTEDTPQDLDPQFLAVDMDDISLPHTVQDYRRTLEDEPRTAVQELTRKSLQGLAALEERKRANRAIRAGGVGGEQSVRKKTGRAPAPQVTSGAWLPMPPAGTSQADSDGEDLRPAAKRRKAMVVRKPAASKSSNAASTARAGRKSRGGASRKRGNGGGRQKKRRSVTPEPQSTSDSAAFEIPVEFDDGDDSDVLPTRISRPRSSQFNQLVEPVTFDVDGGSSSAWDLDSDAMGSAISIRPMPQRRLTYIEPRQALFKAAAGRPARQQGKAPDAPAISSASRGSRSTLKRKRSSTTGVSRDDTTATAGTTQGIRRSGRLNVAR